MKPKNSERLGYIILLAPTLVLLFFFFVVPAVGSLFFSLTDQMLVGQRMEEVSFVGLHNYTRLFTDTRVLSAFANTIILMVSAIVIQQLAGFFIASLLADKSNLVKKIVHMCLYSGALMPEVATAFVFFLLFSVDGLINHALLSVGLKSIAWLIDYPLPVIILAQVWSGTAYSLITYETSLEAISGNIRDAAKTDGASEGQTLFFIVLPAIRHTIRSNTAILTLNNLGVFGLIYMLTGGGPLFKSTNLPILVFRNSISGSDTGYGLTLTFVLFCLGMLFSLLYVRIIHENTGDKE